MVPSNNTERPGGAGQGGEPVGQQVGQQGVHHAQIMKGALDMCLLATIERQPNYGYGMVRLLNDQGLSITNESTIYPVLKRLSTRGLIESYLEPSSEGPARKYYRATPDGTATLGEWVSDWNFVRDGVDAVLSTIPKKKS